MKAQKDLLSARALLEHTPPIPDTACFHRRQAVEKALKGFLVWQGVRFGKVRNLVYLLHLCEGVEPRFAEVRQPAETLAPFAVDIRYPGGPLDVSAEEAGEAVAAAQAVWDLVLALVPPEMHPA